MLVSTASLLLTSAVSFSKRLSGTFMSSKHPFVCGIEFLALSACVACSERIIVTAAAKIRFNVSLIIIVVGEVYVCVKFVYTRNL